MKQNQTKMKITPGSWDKIFIKCYEGKIGNFEQVTDIIAWMDKKFERAA